jgi:hypothetical protein
MLNNVIFTEETVQVYNASDPNKSSAFTIDESKTAQVNVTVQVNDDGQLEEQV